MQAQFDSRCLECTEDIEEGDEIFYDADDDEWVCESCAEFLDITKDDPFEVGS